MRLKVMYKNSGSTWVGAIQKTIVTFTQYLVKTQSWPCLWESPHLSDIRCKIDPNGKAWGNPRTTHAAGDTKTSSYSSSRCKRLIDVAFIASLDIV